MKYFLDTNTIIYFIKGTYPSIKSHFLRTPSINIVIPSIVTAEIEYGAHKSKNYSSTISPYRNFINAFEVIPFDDRITSIYGKIRANLEKEGQIIDPNDLLIAATTLFYSGTLVTKNVREYSRIPNLNVVDWTEE